MVKNQANKLFHSQKYQQAEQEFRKAMDMFSSFFDSLGVDSSKDQDLQGPKQEQTQGQGCQTQRVISQTNIYDMYCESHINLGIC